MEYSLTFHSRLFNLTYDVTVVLFIYSVPGFEQAGRNLSQGTPVTETIWIVVAESSTKNNTFGLNGDHFLFWFTKDLMDVLLSSN